MNFPSINGYKNFLKASQTDANIMLGNSHNLNLLFNRTPKLQLSSYENLSSTPAPTGFKSFEHKILDSINCKKK